MPSTQDVARSQLGRLPVLVIAAGQSAGRGRGGGEWIDADRPLAVSLAFRAPTEDTRPFSLMAGVAAVRATEGTGLKWPNDLLLAESKVGGILVERAGGVVVVGLGLNLWWPEPPEGMGALFPADPGPEHHAGLGAIWGSEMMALIEAEGWPIDEYRRDCLTLGREVTWSGGGQGRAVDIADDGGLIVDTPNARDTIYSGVVSTLRH